MDDPKLKEIPTTDVKLTTHKDHAPSCVKHHWDRPPRNILVGKKITDKDADDWFLTIVEYNAYR
jgi:hypothetical protein